MAREQSERSMDGKFLRGAVKDRVFFFFSHKLMFYYTLV